MVSMFSELCSSHQDRMLWLAGPPPSQPPPPLPPQTVLQTPHRSLFIPPATPQPLPVPLNTAQPGTSSVSVGQPSTQTVGEPLPAADALSLEAYLLQPPERRASAEKRKSIEYQLLEETDAPPQSPPRLLSPAMSAALVNSNEVS